MPLISVVIPVYNVEEYLPRCMASVLAQSYGNLDIILIDDGSTDNSGHICDQYAGQDSRIRVIHKKNGGLSDARNKGIESAKGQYITFIDSDDSIDEDMIEYLYCLLKKHGCRMSLSSHYVVYNREERAVAEKMPDEKLSDKECIKRMCYQGSIDTSAWAKLYEISVFKTIRYPKGKLFEDIGTTYKTFLECKEIACGYQAKYYYYIRPQSITTRAFNCKKLDLLEQTDQMAEGVLRIYPELAKAVLSRQVYARFSTVNQMLDTEEYKEVRDELIQYIKSNALSILRNRNVSNGNKIAMCLIYCSFDLYKYVWVNFKNLYKKANVR